MRPTGTKNEMPLGAAFPTTPDLVPITYERIWAYSPKKTWVPSSVDKLNPRSEATVVLSRADPKEKTRPQLPFISISRGSKCRETTLI